MNTDSIIRAVEFLANREIVLPLDLHVALTAKGLLNPFKRSTMKQAEDIAEANTEYHDIITESLIDYFESDDPVTQYKNSFKQGTLNAFYDAFDLGWSDGGGELPIDDDDAKSWLEARVNQELGFIDALFQEAKELRKEEDFDWFEWATSRADGYVRTLAEVYNQGTLRAREDIMVTFDGDDGEESCADCQKLRGKRHKVSWFVKRNYVPPFGSSLECGRGGHCQHGLFDDEGNQITI